MRVLSLLVLVIGGVALFAAYQALNTPPKTPVVAVSKESAGSFDQKVGAVATQVSQGGGQAIHLVLSEQEVTSKVRQALAQTGSQAITDPTVKLGNGMATLYATAEVSGLSTPVDASLRLGANQGKLSVQVVSVEAAGLPLPGTIQQQLTQKVLQAAGVSDLQSIDVGIDVQSVQISNGQLQVDGRTR